MATQLKQLPYKAKKQLRAEHESRTGERANMRMFSFFPWKNDGAGAVTRYMQYDGARGVDKRDQACAGYSLVRTYGRKWRVEYRTGRTFNHGYATIPVVRKVDSPLFDGPIAAAIWLQVEIANGNVRFTESKSPAGAE